MSASITTILVTGGAGFIGSHCVLELLNSGLDVVVVDNFANSVSGKGDNDKNGNAISLQRVEQLTGKSVHFYNVDIVDKSGLDDVFKKHAIDCVIHCAALKSVNESLTIPLTYYNVNITGTVHLLEVMKEHNVGKIVFSSSCTVYGQPKYFPIDEKHSRGDGITNVYGRTKYFMEEVLTDLYNSDTKKWNIILLRYFNPVGAHPSGVIGEDPRGIPNNLMPYVSQVAVGKLPYVHVYGSDYETPDGSGVRDYIHIMDLAKAHVAAVKKLESSVGLKVYNLGTGRGYSVLEMVAAFSKACGKEVPYKIEGRRAGDVAMVYCNPDLAAADLHWKAELTLDDMCRDLWNWQQKNPDGFQA